MTKKQTAPLHEARARALLALKNAAMEKNPEIKFRDEI